MSFRVCSTPGCPTIHEATGRCADCRRKAEQARRGGRNPYSSRGHQRFRSAVLARNPRCVCPGDCGDHRGWCGKRATVADHFPLERDELIAQGLNPNGAEHGRGVCASCHSKKTARTRPGGWHAER